MATAQDPNLKYAYFESFLQDYDLDVELQCKKLERVAERLEKEIAAEEIYIKTKWPKNIREMPIQEFIKKYQCDSLVQGLEHKTSHPVLPPNPQLIVQQALSQTLQPNLSLEERLKQVEAAKEALRQIESHFLAQSLSSNQLYFGSS